MDINIGKGRLQGEGRSRLESCGLGCACFVPEPGQNIVPSIVEEKQVGFEIVGLSCNVPFWSALGLDS